MSKQILTLCLCILTLAVYAQENQKIIPALPERTTFSTGKNMNLVSALPLGQYYFVNRSSQFFKTLHDAQFMDSPVVVKGVVGRKWKRKDLNATVFLTDGKDPGYQYLLLPGDVKCWVMNYKMQSHQINELTNTAGIKYTK